MRFAALLLVPALCAAQSAPAPRAAIRFEDVSRHAGLTKSHITSPDELYIMESTSGGVGFIDCDNDGKLDIVVVNGSTVDRFRKGGDPMVTLYHQEPGMKFEDITAAAGLVRKGWGMGVAVADFDNDGWQDLYITGYGTCILYHNVSVRLPAQSHGGPPNAGSPGSGTGSRAFEDVTAKAGVGPYPTRAAATTSATT